LTAGQGRVTIRVYNCALNRHHRRTRSPSYGPPGWGFVVPTVRRLEGLLTRMDTGRGEHGAQAADLHSPESQDSHTATTTPPDGA
jgi:predicted SPOUT superfamily RNA methylase MTH1